jgi:hypothetical protein
VFKDETFFVNAGGFCCEADMLPDHPALPKIAAWLVDHPMADDDLTILVDDMQRGKAPYPPGMRALETLAAALTPDAPATEEAANGR